MACNAWTCTKSAFVPGILWNSQPLSLLCALHLSCSRDDGAKGRGDGCCRRSVVAQALRRRKGWQRVALGEQPPFSSLCSSGVTRTSAACLTEYMARQGMCIPSVTFVTFFELHYRSAAQNTPQNSLTGQQGQAHNPWLGSGPRWSHLNHSHQGLTAAIPTLVCTTPFCCTTQLRMKFCGSANTTHATNTAGTADMQHSVH